MIRYFVLGGTFAAICALGIAACVSDTTTPTDAGSEAATEAGGPCVSIASQPGVDCFSGGRCALSTQSCCTGLTGNGLVGQCAPADAGCALPFPVPWPCDKGFDCPPTAGKCCATTEASQLLFASINTSDGGCPIPLHPVDVSDAGDAAFPTFSVTKCQTSCSSFQLCSTPTECPGGQRCVPARFEQSSFSKTFGICLP